MKKRTVLRSAAALALTVVMVLALALPALAASANQIKIDAPIEEPGDANRFVAYQVFSGALVSGKPDEINGITWGSGVNSSTLLEKLQSSTQPVPVQDGKNTFGGQFTDAYEKYRAEYDNQLKDAEFVAQWLGRMSETYIDSNAYNPYADAFARAVAASLNTTTGTATKTTSDGRALWTIDVGTPGYYMVKDTYSGTAASVSSYILRVLGSTTVTIKASIPTVTKKVEGQDGYLTGTNNKLTYTLTGKVSANISEYSTYAYKFTDKLSPGLTADLASVQVTLSANGGVSAVFDRDDTNGYSVSLAPDGTNKEAHTLTVEFKDLLKAISAKAGTLNLRDKNIVNSIEITVSYQAVLNEYAVMGSAGNENDVFLTYSNDPYNESTGETAHDEVKTYGIGLQILKVDEEENLLENIEFKLQNSINQYATFKTTTDNNETYYAITGWGADLGDASVLKTNSSGIINIHGLDVGKYTLTETKTNDDLELMQPIVFTITSSENGAGHVKSDGSFPANVTFELDSTDKNRHDVEVKDSGFAAHSAQVELTNYPLPILPHTGGIGAGIVYLVSALAVVTGAAIVYLATRKRGRGRHEQSR